MKSFRLMAQLMIVAGLCSLMTACNFSSDKTPESDGTKLWPASMSNSEKMGYINAKGVFVVQPQYDYACAYSCGVAIACNYNDKTGKAEYYILDSKGNASMVMADGIEDGYFINDMLPAYAGKDYGYLDKKGNWAIFPQFEDVTHFYDGLARVEQSDYYGFIDKSSKWVIMPQFEWVSVFGEGLAVNRTPDKKYNFIDKKGRIAIQQQYDGAGIFQEGLAPISLGSKEGYIDKSGNIKIACIYDDAEWFNEGLAMVEQNDKIGYINKKGETIVPCIYAEGTDFYEGMAFVWNTSGKMGVINKKGEIVINFGAYDECGSVFHNGLALVVKEGDKADTYYYINKNNEVVYSWSMSSDYYAAPRAAKARNAEKAFAPALPAYLFGLGRMMK